MRARWLVAWRARSAFGTLVSKPKPWMLHWRSCGGQVTWKLGVGYKNVFFFFLFPFFMMSVWIWNHMLGWWDSDTVRVTCAMTSWVKKSQKCHFLNHPRRPLFRILQPMFLDSRNDHHEHPVMNPNVWYGLWLQWMVTPCHLKRQAEFRDCTGPIGCLGIICFFLIRMPRCNNFLLTGSAHHVRIGMSCPLRRYISYMGLSENVVCLNPMVNDQFPY